MNEDMQNRIDDYIRGRLTEDERIEFEADLNKDESLRKAYLETKAIADAIADREEKLMRMRQWDKEAKIAESAENRGNNKRGWIIGLSAVACVAVLFIAVRGFIGKPSHDTEFVMPDFSQSVYYRGGNDMAYLDSLINSEAYTPALNQADSILLAERDEISVLTMKDSLSEKENYKLLQHNELVDELEWRKANLLIALKRVEEGRDLLRIIAAKEGVHKAEADSLLKVL